MKYILSSNHWDILFRNQFYMVIYIYDHKLSFFRISTHINLMIFHLCLCIWSSLNVHSSIISPNFCHKAFILFYIKNIWKHMDDHKIFLSHRVLCILRNHDQSYHSQIPQKRGKSFCNCVHNPFLFYKFPCILLLEHYQNLKHIWFLSCYYGCCIEAQFSHEYFITRSLLWGL